MAEISWIKLKTAMFDDEKVKMIESMPEADAILVIWIKLLVLAGKTNDNGLIYIQRNMPYTDEMLSVLFNKQLSTIRLAIATLEKFKMIEVGENRELIISNWEKHQNIEGMDKIRQQNAERVAKHREKKKLLGNVTGNVTVTESNATDKNNRNRTLQTGSPPAPCRRCRPARTHGGGRPPHPSGSPDCPRRSAYPG